MMPGTKPVMIQARKGNLVITNPDGKSSTQELSLEETKKLIQEPKYIAELLWNFSNDEDFRLPRKGTTMKFDIGGEVVRTYELTPLRAEGVGDQSSAHTFNILGLGTLYSPRIEIESTLIVHRYP